MNSVRTLYICYFGLREPLVQAQVIPYLRALAAAGVNVHLLTFEPQRRKRWTPESTAEWRTRLRTDGIEWSMAGYHRWPPLLSKVLDIIAGTAQAVRIARRSRVDVLHGRSDIGAAIGALVKRVAGGKLIFDVRGLVADEFAESGHWPAGGFLYRLTRRAERHLQRAADALVVLTERARQEFFAAETRPLEVVPCCVDRARFTPLDPARRNAMRDSLGARHRIVVIYTGSMGGTYPAHAITAFFAAARACDRRVFPLVLTHESSDEMNARLAGAGFAPHDFHVASVGPEDVPPYIAASDIALSIIRPGYAKLAMSPTKFAEYLACGVPVISTRGIGDLDAQIERERIGVLIDGFDADSYHRAFQMMEALRRDPGIQGRCLAVASRDYDLHSVAAVRYERLYRRVTAT